MTERHQGFDLAAYLRRFPPELMRNPDCRRVLTRKDPLLFALTYLPHHLRGSETNDEVTLSEFHLDVIEQAKQWRHAATQPAEHRDCYVAPRAAGKSTWFFLILPMWLAAHGHRKFIAAFAHSGSQAELHLATFRNELDRNELLAEDYPELCIPRRRARGTAESDNRNMLVTQSGFVFAAKGVDSSSLGMKVGKERPDLLLCHALGTLMRTENGDWIPVERHSSFRGSVIREGFEVRLHGLPEPEVVTPEHRYWARRHKGGEHQVDGRTQWVADLHATPPDWVEAQHLDTDHWIGAPIDYTHGELGAVDFYAPSIVRDPETGRVVTSIPGFVPKIPDEFTDPDWWWFFGLWWGDGSINGKHQIGVTTNINDVRVIARVENLLRRYNIGYSHRPRVGCTQIVFSRGHLNRWLRTWRIGPSRKQPPAWVERLDDRMLRELVWGYVDADGFVDRAAQAVRVTSIHLPGLLALRRIMARLGAAGLIRPSGGTPGPREIAGTNTFAQRKYDLRCRQGAALLGFPFADQDRYAFPTSYVADGMLWTRVRTITPVAKVEFAPIKTRSGTYVTHFGLSHNCDDVEPDESNYSGHQKDKRLSTLTDAILPLNIYARVVLVGTVTMPGSIVHDLVKTITKPGEPAPDWIAEEKFRVHYYEPIITDPETGVERSIWPAKWPLAYLKSIERTRQYKKNYLNDPMGRDGEYWREDDFHHMEVPGITHQVITIDPAVTKTDRSDFTAVAVVAYAAVTKRVVVRYAMARRVQPGHQLRDWIRALLDDYPETRAVVVETNQGGDVWRDSVLKGLAVPVKTVRQSDPKEVRAARALNWYQRRRPDGLPCVVHECPLTQAEEQMVGFPKARHDDLVDTIGTGISLFLRRSGRARSSMVSAEPRFGVDSDDVD